MVEHGNLANLIAGLLEALPLSGTAEGRRVGLAGSFAFDGAIKQWSMLAAGRQPARGH